MPSPLRRGAIFLPKILIPCTAAGTGTRYRRYRRYRTYGSRERNPIALFTLGIYVPLSKFESIHRVYRYLYDGTGTERELV